MSYGLKIVNADGTVWMSPDFTPLNLTDKGVLSSSAGSVYQSFVPADHQCIFFVKFSSNGKANFSHITQNGFHALRIDYASGTGDITVYCFGDLCINPPKYGIFMFNAQGRLVWTANMLPLEVIQVSLPTGTSTVDVGFPCAVLPLFSALYSVPNSGLGGYDTYRRYTGAVGSLVTNNGRQVAWNTGPTNFSYSTSALVINTSKYD